MKANVIETKTIIYKFDDMTIYEIAGEEVTEVFVEVENDLIYVFGYPTNNPIDIEALHDNGYFDEYSFADKAMRFLHGERIEEEDM